MDTKWTVEGWGWPMKSRKAHYFVDGRSLCGGWPYRGEPILSGPESTPDDCKECTRRLAKRRQDQGQGSGTP